MEQTGGGGDISTSLTAHRTTSIYFSAESEELLGFRTLSCFVTVSRSHVSECVCLSAGIPNTDRGPNKLLILRPEPSRSFVSSMQNARLNLMAFEVALIRRHTLYRSISVWFGARAGDSSTTRSEKHAVVRVSAAHTADGNQKQVQEVQFNYF